MTEHHRKIRSFVRRPGRTTKAQQKALAELLPRYGIDYVEDRIDLEEVFGRRAERVLDVGFGNGETLLTLAANHPTIDYLGVEVHEPGIGRLLLLVERAGLGNVRVIAHDAVEVIARMLPDESIDAVNILFPDPWPKKRHHKRRLIQPDFVAQLARVLRPGGLLRIATDWANYAEHIAEVLARNADFDSAAPETLADDPLAERPPTKFERQGRRMGHDVVDLCYRRKGSSR